MAIGVRTSAMVATTAAAGATDGIDRGYSRVV